jgi:hypothetical protein
MQRSDSEAQDLMARFLAGRLSDSETARFEAWWQRNPDAIRDIDHVARLQDGLHGLRARGELEPLLRRSWWTGTLRFMAMAASVAAVALLAWLWQAATPGTPLRIAALPTDFDVLARQAPAQAQYFMTLRSRDNGSAVVLPTSPVALHWRLLPDTPSADGRYHVSLTPMVDGAVADDAGTTALASVAADGFVDVYADSRTLRPGRYWLALEPLAAPERHARHAGRFAITVSSGDTAP